MSDQRFRDAMESPAPESVVPPGSRNGVLKGVGRRRRMRPMVAVGGIAVAVAAVFVLGSALWPKPDRVDDPATAVDAGGWEPIAKSPLAARDGALYAWTGTELLVVGGADWWCPDEGACEAPSGEDFFHDGAAYNPATDSWRELPETDQVIWNAPATWTGQELVVAMWAEEGGTTMALDPVAGVWRDLPPPPGPVGGGLWTGDRLVFWVGDDVVGADWALDPTTGKWTPLPEDPFGVTVHRSYGWTGQELVLAAQPDNQNHLGPYEVATLDLNTGQWEPWPTSPVTDPAQDWFVFDGHWVNALPGAQPHGPPESAGGAADLATQEWTDVPQAANDYEAPVDACQLPPLGASGDWLAAGGGALVSLNPPVATLTPPCEPITQPMAGAWTGKEFIIWGGSAPAGNTDLGLRWTPPSLR